MLVEDECLDFCFPENTAIYCDSIAKVCYLLPTKSGGEVKALATAVSATLGAGVWSEPSCSYLPYVATFMGERQALKVVKVTAAESDEEDGVMGAVCQLTKCAAFLTP